MSDDEIDTLGPDGQGSARVDRDRRAPRFSWTPAYEATFFRSLCDSVQLGLRENSSFKAEAWERAAQALADAHGAHPAKSHLINKSDNARKRFRLWRGLREDPDFVYSPTTRSVTASEEAWKAHIEREPLSRALRGRPFDHEDYMEVLYPDVIGSGGAPKRVMKPRRRTDGTFADDSDMMPGTGVLNLQQSDDLAKSSGALEGFSQPRPPLQQTPSGSSSGSLQSQRSASTAHITVPPTGANAALTPPDEVGSSISRKRSFQASHGAVESASSSGNTLPSLAVQSQQNTPNGGGKRRRTPSYGAPSFQAPASGSAVHLSTVHSNPNSGGRQQDADLQSTVEEMLDVFRTRAASQWREQALDIFFRDFADEDLDLQVKVSESVLSNEGKAMVFCKMPIAVRQHWIRRYRSEMHHRPS